jgi:hypothetical protein
MLIPVEGSTETILISVQVGISTDDPSVAMFMGLCLGVIPSASNMKRSAVN